MRKKQRKSILPSKYIRKPWVTILIVLALIALGVVTTKLVRQSSAEVWPTGTYSEWHWPTSSTGFDNFEWYVTPETDASPDGYFYSHQFALKNGEGGYFGIQTQGSAPTGKIAIFSIWDALTSESPQYAAEFGGEGVGRTARISYNWIPGRTYRLRVAITSADSTGRWWSAWIQDTSTGTESYVGRIKVEPSRGKLDTWSIMWSERYSALANTCNDMRFSAVRFSTPTANNGSVRPASHTNRLQDGRTACASGSQSFNVSGGVAQWMASPNAPPSSASVRIQSAPTSVVAGSTFTASVTARNIGTDTWSAGQNYKLGSQNPENSTIWGTTRVLLPSNLSIPYGGSHTFTGSFKAPSTPGTYIFSWKMLREGVTWFGETASKTIQVTAPTTPPPPILQPDLVVTDITPVTATVNTPVTFKATIKNQGTSPTPSGVIHGVAFRINGTLVSWSDAYTSSLAAGASVTVTANGGPTNATWTPTAAGTVSVEAFVDDRDRITTESNETNNKLTRSVVISSPATTPGDVDGNGMVNGIDLSTVLANYGMSGQTRTQGDLDSNGTVNALDLSAVLTNYGR